APGDVCLHLFTDGRDTGPTTGKKYVQAIQAKCDEVGVGRIASVIGRYFAMDRDNRWERVAMAYGALTGSSSEIANYATAVEAVQAYYDNPVNDSQTGDEFVPPSTVGDDPASSRIADGDTVVFYNYRGDRPREITRAFMQPDFRGNVPPSPDSGEKGFDRAVNGTPQLNLRYVCMTAYDKSFKEFPGLSVAFDKPARMEDIGGDWLAKHGKTQFRCAETEKFPHVTFFFNDYRDEPFDGETREMAQSPKVATYDLKPDMSAFEIRDLVLQRINAGPEQRPDFILVNFANGDMVGHTGKLDAAVKACEAVDQCVGAIVEATLAAGGKLVVTADHGNAEQMTTPETGDPHTSHTLYDVDLILVDPDRAGLASGSPDRPSAGLRSGGALADVFPTVLDLLGLPAPSAMTGRSLLKPG
ncbi:MAG: 2,3-bisphosphoglycerate-independent phosphoglycerate mutase, partial [Planctomycetota bacterium]